MAAALASQGAAALSFLTTASASKPSEKPILPASSSCAKCTWNYSPVSTTTRLHGHVQSIGNVGLGFRFPGRSSSYGAFSSPGIGSRVFAAREEVPSEILEDSKFVRIAEEDPRFGPPPQGAAIEQKSSFWSGQVRSPFYENTASSLSQQQSRKPAIAVSFSADDGDQERVSRGLVSRREWLLSSAVLASVVAVPSNAHGLSQLSDICDNNSASIANGDAVVATQTPKQAAEDVKSWYRYRGQGFVIRVPPGYEDILDPGNEEEEEGSSPYGERAKDKPFAARFASPDGDEVLSIVVKPASKLRLSFFETKDISDFGSIKEAAGNFVPAGAKLVSARIINSKASRVPRTYYMYEFLTRGMHFTMSAGVSKGMVYVLGASAPQAKWKDYGGRLQLAASTFFLP